MQTTIRLQDLIYFHQNKPDTYQYFIARLKERMTNGETLEIIIEGSITHHPENVREFEKFVISEVEKIHVE